MWTRISTASLLAIIALTGCNKNTGPEAIPVEPDPEAVVYEELRAVPVSAVGTLVEGSGVVSEVFSDRGFWVGVGESRVLVIVREDEPKHEMIDIDVGDRLDMTALVMTADMRDDLKGDLEPETVEALVAEERFLATHWRWIEITEEGVNPTNVVRSGLSTGDLIEVVYTQDVDVYPDHGLEYVIVDFDDWDADGDGSLDRTEVGTGLEEQGDLLFDGFDVSGDGLLETDEFVGGMLDVLDRNNNGEVHIGSFYATLAAWYPQIDTERWSDWDTDGDERLNELELNTAIGGRDGLWTHFTTADDKHIDAEEFRSGVFDAWDTDADGEVTLVEYRLGTHLWYSQFQGEVRFQTWDLDNDAVLDRTELIAGVAGTYPAWDFDGDTEVDEAELLTALYRTWDLDDDGFIEPWEYDGAWFRDDDAGWELWDTDGDGEIDIAEFDARVTTLALYDAWDSDGDGLLSDEEVGTALFELWDTDDDGALELVEYRAY